MFFKGSKWIQPSKWGEIEPKATETGEIKWIFEELCKKVVKDCQERMLMLAKGWKSKIKFILNQKRISFG